MFTNLAYSPLLEKVSSKELNKAYKIDVEISPSLHLQLRQDIYTFILRCSDLNFAYTDSMHDHYNFRNHGEYFRSKDYILKNSISIRLPALKLALLKEAKSYDSDPAVMSESDSRSRSNGDSGGSLRKSTERTALKAPEREILSELVLERPEIDI